MSCATTFGALLDAELGPTWDKNPFRRRSNFRVRSGSNFGASWAGFWSHVGRISEPNLGPRRVSKLKRSMCTKVYYLQYETMFFALPGGSKIEGKPMPKRLQDKIGFQEAKDREKVSNIGASWRPKSRQVASNSEGQKWFNLRSLPRGGGSAILALTCGMRGPPGGI